MTSELNLSEFVKNAIATKAEWKKFEKWGDGSLIDPGYWKENEDPALRDYVNSVPSAEWHQREAIYKKWNKKIIEVLRGGNWEAYSKVGSSTIFTPIEIAVASKLHSKLHENLFSVDGRTYAIVVFRELSEVSNTEALKNFIEIVCETLDPENIVKDDVRKLAEALLEFSFSKGHFHNVWLNSEVDPECPSSDNLRQMCVSLW